MTPDRLPADQKTRDRVTTDFDTTFLLEAGAGTGKTTVLVNRVLALVRSGRAPIDRIVAITFTDKAAGELKLRLRDDIEKAIEKAAGEEKERLERAADDLERAPVSTIHSFALGLLKERPLEAGLDPGFSVVAEVASDRTLDDAWDRWLEKQMSDGNPVLVRAMSCGLDLENLRKAAKTVVNERDILGLEEKEPIFKEDSLLDTMRAAVKALKPLKTNCTEPEDGAYQSILDLEADVARAERLDGTNRERFLRELGVDAKHGQQGNWTPREACKSAKAQLQAVKDAQEAYTKASDAHLNWAVRDQLRGFLKAYEEAKADAAVVDFQDLLLRARDLLQGQVPVRRYFQRRFDFILVDEFQDTDPLQAELAFLLAEDPDGKPAADWRGCRLKPGKLFVVGDPKQSIYRFRRADIQVYEEAKRLVEKSGGEVLALTTNFRTVPSILEFVNERFEEVFQDPALDPKPIALKAHREEVNPEGARTLALAVPPDHLKDLPNRNVPTITPLIARTVAAFLDEITNRRPWSIRDGDTVRPARPGDVALLVRRLTPDFIEHHEKALTAQGVPYRLVGGKEYYARDEVKALANVLKAIDNPANRRAVFAALRSPFFGFSDDDLWQLVAKGGHLNYQAPVPGEARGADALVKAFDLLKTLHRRRRMFPPSDLIVRLFERTHALAAYRLRPATLTTLRTLVRHLEEETEGKTEEGDSPVGDQAGAQVQVLSVHRAKGLEYPIVVLGDILYGNSKARDCVVHHADKRGWLKIGPFEPEAWDDTVESEKAQSAAEERRLLYVALTRARDHLVIPCLPDDLPKGPMSSIIEGVIQPNRPVPFGRKASSLVEGGTKNGRAKIAFGDTPSLTYPGEAREHPSSMTTVEGSGEDAHRARGAESDWRRCRPSFRGAPSPSSDEEATIEPALSDHAAAAFGTLVHKLLALPESPTRDALLRTASTLAPALGLRQDDAHEAAHLAQHARDLPALAAARTADVIHRELPFVCRANGRPLVGRLDLAYRVAGAWTIIDFRTAPLASATEARSRYSPQVGRYRAALAALTGEPVSASLCLVRTGELVAIEEEPPPTAG